MKSAKRLSLPWAPNKRSCGYAAQTVTLLIDECLHTSLAAVAHDNGQDGFHIIGLARATKRIEILLDTHRRDEQRAGFPKDLRQAIAP
ncbi:hypothetical protein [Ensifer adhaerens]|uniref:hypothetical protein n=1 Tax=Ensifer adhaerens TaxID=106592 RepID=UPI001F1EC124|nr:hypothetical protein [Ensifer adhaerens]